MRRGNLSFVIQIVFTYFVLLKYEIKGIVFKPGKSFKKLEHDMDSNYNALSRILQDSTITREKHGDFECKQEWPNIILKDTLICYCKDNEKEVKINVLINTIFNLFLLFPLHFLCKTTYILLQFQKMNMVPLVNM